MLRGPRARSGGSGQTEPDPQDSKPNYRLVNVSSVRMQSGHIDYARQYLDKMSEGFAEAEEFYFDVPADSTIILMICRKLGADF